MNYDRLTLLILATALEDLISYELGKEIEISPTEDIDALLYTAEEMIGKHPELINRLLARQNLDGWLQCIKVAKEELVEVVNAKHSL